MICPAVRPWMEFSIVEKREILPLIWKSRGVRSGSITSVVAKTEPVSAKPDKDDADKQEAEADRAKGSPRRAAGGK